MGDTKETFCDDKHGICKRYLCLYIITWTILEFVFYMIIETWEKYCISCHYVFNVNLGKPCMICTRILCWCKHFWICFVYFRCVCWLREWIGQFHIWSIFITQKEIKCDCLIILDVYVDYENGLDVSICGQLSSPCKTLSVIVCLL